MKFLLFLSFVFFGSLASTSPAEAVCSTHDRIGLANAGYSKSEIEDFCGKAAASMPPPAAMHILSGEGQARWSQWCGTPQGSCPLNPILGYYPVGAPCNCYMPWGFSAGVAQ